MFAFVKDPRNVTGTVENSHNLNTCVVKQLIENDVVVFSHSEAAEIFIVELSSYCSLCHLPQPLLIFPPQIRNILLMHGIMTCFADSLGFLL